MAQSDPAIVPTVESDAAVTVLFNTVAPVTVKDARVPTDVRDDAVTPLASVAPVRPEAGTAAAVIAVLHPNPVLVVQMSASAAAEQDAIAWAVGEAVPAVALTSTVFAAWVAISPNVTSPVAVRELVTVRPEIDGDVAPTIAPVPFIARAIAVTTFVPRASQTMTVVAELTMKQGAVDPTIVVVPGVMELAPPGVTQLAAVVLDAVST